MPHVWYSVHHANKLRIAKCKDHVLCHNVEDLVANTKSITLRHEAIYW